MTAERVTLYRHIPPLGRTVQVEVTLFPIEDSILEKAEVAGAVNFICLNCLGEPLGMRAENLCQWFREGIQEKDLDATNWEMVVALVHSAFLEESLTDACTW